MRLLQHVAGTAQFDEKMGKINNSLQDAFNKKQILAGVLAEIELKLDGLQVEKEAFKEVEEIEMKKKACQKALYVGKAKRNDR